MRSFGGKNFSLKPFKLFYPYYFLNQVWRGLGWGGPDPPDPLPGSATDNSCDYCYHGYKSYHLSAICIHIRFQGALGGIVTQFEVCDPSITVDFPLDFNWTHVNSLVESHFKPFMTACRILSTPALAPGIVQATVTGPGITTQLRRSIHLVITNDACFGNTNSGGINALIDWDSCVN